MRIGLFKRFTPDDYPELPGWAEQFFQQLNNALEDITNALTRNLTFEDNLRAEVIKLDLKHDVSTPIQLKVLKRNPIIGFFGGSNYFEYSDFSWEISPDKSLTVDVKIKWFVPPDKPVRCILVFLGGEADVRGEE